MMVYGRLLRCLKCSGSETRFKYDANHDMIIRQCVRCEHWWWEDTVGNEIVWASKEEE